MLVVDPSSVATSPLVMPNLPRLRLYDLLGCFPLRFSVKRRHRRLTRGRLVKGEDIVQ